MLFFVVAPSICVWINFARSLLCGVVTINCSGFAIIFLRKRELVV